MKYWFSGQFFVGTQNLMCTSRGDGSHDSFLKPKLIKSRIKNFLLHILDQQIKINLICLRYLLGWFSTSTASS
jgi:hypothetical protein